MADYRIRPRARIDLEEIWAYTAETWSEAQADKYVGRLFTAFEQLAENPNLGRDASVVRPGYRQYTTGRHVIFYRPEPAPIDIVRVLHDRMLPDRHV